MNQKNLYHLLYALAWFQIYPRTNERTYLMGIELVNFTAKYMMIDVTSYSGSVAMRLEVWGHEVTYDSGEIITIYFDLIQLFILYRCTV